jgi:hypothetical protein
MVVARDTAASVLEHDNFHLKNGAANILLVQDHLFLGHALVLGAHLDGARLAGVAAGSSHYERLLAALILGAHLDGAAPSPHTQKRD